MLKYLIVQLDDTSVSFCHYPNSKTERKLIPFQKLKEAILWSMKENLTLQFLYPDYPLPEEYTKEIAKTFHADIVSEGNQDSELVKRADVVVFDSFSKISTFEFKSNCAYVVRTNFDSLFENQDLLFEMLQKADRINVILTDIENFNSDREKKYSEFLSLLSDAVFEEFKKTHSVQINLLTDRIMLDSMNNCNAGAETITLSPEGKFYICPGFIGDEDCVGDLNSGLNIKNKQLFTLKYAPICRKCDAFQCKRCVWLNRKETFEVNTPSREQCVIAHLERNASRALLMRLQEGCKAMLDKEINQVDYLDPFEIVIKD